MPDREQLAALEDRVAALEHERRWLRFEVAHARWRVKAMQARRWWRLGMALRDAVRDPRALLRLPVTLARIAFGPSERPLEPVPDVPPLRVPVPVRERIKALLASGEYERALAETIALLQEYPDNLQLLDLRRQALGKLGDLPAVLEAAVALRRVRNSVKHETLEAITAGRLHELDTRWLPDIPGPPEPRGVAGGPRPPSVPLTPAAPTKVLHLLKESLPYHVNGYTMRSGYTLLAQRAAGLDPVVVTSLGFPRTQGHEDVTPVEPVDGVPHYRLDLGPEFPYATTPLDELLSLTAWRAAEIVRAERPAILHAGSGFRGYETALVGLALKRHFGLPLVYEVRSFLEHTWTPDFALSERAPLFELRAAAELRCMQAADAVLTIAESMRDDLIARGVPPDKIALVPNGVEADRFTPAPPDPGLRQALGLGAGPVFGYISNLGAREGIDVLIEGLALVAREGHAFSCLLVGQGPERARLEALARARGIADRVRFAGPVPHDEIARYYALIDVFVIPRRDDRAARLVTPLKPFEAMAMARPLLVADLPALVELAAPGERGLAFRVEDPVSLAEQARAFLRDPQLGPRLGANGRAWVERERRWELNGPRYRAVYERLWAAPVEA